MNKITKQEAFDRVWQHFVVEENLPGYDSVIETCCYRHKGKKCAIGIMIPDEIYKEEMECNRASKLFYIFPEVANLFDFDSLFALKLQNCHDYAATGVHERFLQLIEMNLRGLAETYNLQVPNAEASTEDDGNLVGSNA